MAKPKETKQKEIPASAEYQAVLNLFRTSDLLQHRLAKLYREHGLTSAQYNILRILRDEGAALPCLQLARRTITVVPGITGLIDRLEKAKPALAKKTRDVHDRRVWNVSITSAGLEALNKLDQPVLELHRELLTDFSTQEIADLTRLLDKARQPQEEAADEE